MLKLEFCKQLDQSVVLRCTRQDGSVTWQKQTKHAAHFVLHDLTHYAVETTLGSQLGFLGLIDEGWDFDDTTGRGSRGPLPPEALEVERIVGLFDTERGTGYLLRVDQFQITEEHVQDIRSLRSSLFHQWSALPPGDKLELVFRRAATY